MALTVSALTTLATVKTELKLTTSDDDAYLERLIESVSEFVNKFCNRTLKYDAAVVESVGGFGLTNLLVSRTPVASITSLTYDGQLIDSTTYSLQDAQAGLIYRSTGFAWTASSSDNIAGHDPISGTENPLYVVTYAGGYVSPEQATQEALPRTLPFDLEDAVVEIVATRYKARGSSNPFIKSEKLLNYSVTYAGVEEAAAQQGSGRKVGSGIPNRARDTLLLYRREPQA